MKRIKHFELGIINCIQSDKLSVDIVLSKFHRSFENSVDRDQLASDSFWSS